MIRATLHSKGDINYPHRIGELRTANRVGFYGCPFCELTLQYFVGIQYGRWTFFVISASSEHPKETIEVLAHQMRIPWGKFDAELGTRHHLAHHCADVAACFSVISHLPVVRARLNQAAGRTLSDLELARLAALAFLHDAGKLHPGFQMRGWPGAVWKDRNGKYCQPHGHVREGLQVFLSTLAIANDLHISALGNWGVGESLLRAVISHHGRPAERECFNLSDAKSSWHAFGPYNPTEAAKELGDPMPNWFADAFSPGGPELPLDNGAFEHLLCGLVTLADWLGSSVQWFPHVGDLDANYMEAASRQAAIACADIGLDPSRQRVVRTEPVTFHALTGYAKANPQQALVGGLDLDARIIILEAETGSGKTEAALWHYMRLFEAGHVDGLYFAVPTRAAAVQLHERIVKAARCVFGEASPQPVLAVPGYLKAGEIEGTALPHWRVLWDDAADGSPETLHARWAAEHSKRYLAAQIAVGTVDQAMMGALTVKHAHLRASSLSRSLLVIDEVHASDAYMTLLQKAMLDAHVAVGGYAMLMSATLGSTARASWLKHAAPDFEAACAIPYPAVWTSNSDAPQSPNDTSPPKQKRVIMESVASMSAEAAAVRALDAARQGARVLVIRNTVDRAVATLVALETLADPADRYLLFKVGNVVTLHHSRFAPTDRKLLDRAVETALTTDKERIPQGCIVIGTQTLEQSLDIDADLLITDLCPVDVLLQRIGRLHRHSLQRPKEFEHPRCIVMAPENGLAPLLGKGVQQAHVRDSAPGLGTVYRDLSILELTRGLVADHACWEIPRMNRQLVEAATHPEAIAELHDKLGPDWQKAHDDVRGGQLGEQLTAQSALIDRTKPFDTCSFPGGAEETIRTRLGEDNIRIDFAEELPPGPFGQPVAEMVLPAWLCCGFSVDGSPIRHAQDGNAVAFSLDDLQFRYDRYGLRRAGGDNDGTQSARGATDPLHDG